MRLFSRGGVFLTLLVLMSFVALLRLTNEQRATVDLDWSAFVARVEAAEVASAEVRGQDVTGKLTDGAPFRTTAPKDTERVADLLARNGVPHAFQKADDQGLWITGALSLVTLVIALGAMWWLVRSIQGTNGRALSFGRSRARLASDGSGKRVTFADVAGIEESKEELQEVVEFLKDPRRFTRLGGRIPKGVLLMGPPGTGKTLLARAVAGEAGVPFFSISGSDFVEMFVGVGASRVRDLFEQGKKSSPCIIFVDEIDAVGRHRGAGLGGGHDEREQTLNALLVEMDGFEGTEGVILIAATNRPDVLDPALLRPGRFDRRIVVANPDVRGREKVLEIHTRRLPLSTDVELSTIARGTPGFSGADLANLCNEAALLAARRDKSSVELADFLGAREKIVMGPERRSMLMPDWERRNTAYHEAGHAIIAHLLPGHDPVQKVTIVPRGRALGVTWVLPESDRLSQTRGGLLRRITMMMGGRAGEEVAMNTVTGGAANDIEQATRLARHMVCDLGMSELGPVAWNDGQDEVFLGRQMSRVQSYSEETARRIDSEIRTIVTRAYDAARGILQRNRHVLDRVAQALMDQESLESAEFRRLVDECAPVVPDDLGWMGT
jgi:cell division protease FtsH